MFAKIIVGAIVVIFILCTFVAWWFEESLDDINKQ